MWKDKTREIQSNYDLIIYDNNISQLNPWKSVMLFLGDLINLYTF